MFELPTEIALVRDTCRAFANDILAPGAAKADEDRQLAPNVLPCLAEMGLLGISVKEKWGGAEMGKLGYAIAVAELSKACASTGAIISVHMLYCHCVQAYGTDEQKEEFLKPYALGTKIGAFALTEPGCGSDASAVRTTAKLIDGEWIINGDKVFVSNGTIAGAVLVFARAFPYGPEAGGRLESQTHQGISAFLVPVGTPGMVIEDEISTMGIRAAPCNTITLRDCKVPESALLGKLEQGFEIAMSQLDGGRIGMAAQALGIGEAALELANQYSKDRVTFGKPIAKHQAIQFKIADMRTKLESSRLLVWKAAVYADSGRPFSVEAAMAKLSASEMATFNAHQAIQVLGGYGFCSEFAAERLYRDARITEIYEGTSEIMRIVIARDSYINC